MLIFLQSPRLKSRGNFATLGLQNFSQGKKIELIIITENRIFT